MTGAAINRCISKLGGFTSASWLYIINSFIYILANIPMQFLLFNVHLTRAYVYILWYLIAKTTEETDGTVSKLKKQATGTRDILYTET